MSLNDDAIKYYESGNLKKAFGLACRFTMSFSTQELKDIHRAHETLVRPGTFERFGWKDEDLILKGVTAFERFKLHLEDRRSGADSS